MSRKYHVRAYVDTLIPDAPYMHRAVLELPFGALRLHVIRRSDAGVHFHDHPFDFVSFMLWGSYREVFPNKPTRYRRLWSWARLSAEGMHRVDLLSPWCVTLVFAGPRRREWGFLTDAGWVGHAQHDKSAR